MSTQNIELFGIGDVVTLKSGGCKMTVVGFDVKYHEHSPVHCKWFKQDINGQTGEIVDDYFPESALIKIK